MGVRESVSEVSFKAPEKNSSYYAWLPMQKDAMIKDKNPTNVFIFYILKKKRDSYFVDKTCDKSTCQYLELL